MVQWNVKEVGQGEQLVRPGGTILREHRCWVGIYTNKPLSVWDSVSGTSAQGLKTHPHTHGRQTPSCPVHHVEEQETRHRDEVCICGDKGTINRMVNNWNLFEQNRKGRCLALSLLVFFYRGWMLWACMLVTLFTHHLYSKTQVNKDLCNHLQHKRSLSTLTPGTSVGHGGSDINCDCRKNSDGDGEHEAHREGHYPDLQTQDKISPT